MSRKSKEMLRKAINYRNYDASTFKKPVKEKPTTDKKVDMKLEFRAATNNTSAVKPTPYASNDNLVSQERLQEAVIWAEILGKPLCKRRGRRRNVI